MLFRVIVFIVATSDNYKVSLSATLSDSVCELQSLFINCCLRIAFYSVAFAFCRFVKFFPLLHFSFEFRIRVAPTHTLIAIEMWPT